MDGEGDRKRRVISMFLFFFFETGFYSVEGQPGTYYVDQARLKFPGTHLLGFLSAEIKGWCYHTWLV